MLAVTWELPRRDQVVAPWLRLARELGRAPVLVGGARPEELYYYQEIHRRFYQAASEALAVASAACLIPSSPSLRDLGIRWMPECCGETWRAWDVLVRRGAADCEDLAAAHVAWLRVVRGELRARTEWERQGALPNGGTAWHVVVRRASGERQDISAELGMADDVGCDPRGPGDSACDPQAGGRAGSQAGRACSQAGRACACRR